MLAAKISSTKERDYEMAQRYVGEALIEIKYSKNMKLKRFVYDTSGMCFLIEACN